MSDNKYLKGIDAVTGVRRSIARITDVLGATPTATAALTTTRPSTTAEFLKSVHGYEDVPDDIGTIAGGAIGAVVWKKHRVLGAIAGSSIGRNTPALLHAEHRRSALCNMGVTGAGVLGSLLMPGTPAVGFIVGWLAGGAAVYYGKLRGE